MHALTSNGQIVAQIDLDSETLWWSILAFSHRLGVTQKLTFELLNKSVISLERKSILIGPCILQMMKVLNETLDTGNGHSINQSNFYSASIPGEARLSGATSWDSGPETRH